MKTPNEIWVSNRYNHEIGKYYKTRQEGNEIRYIRADDIQDITKKLAHQLEHVLDRVNQWNNNSVDGTKVEFPAALQALREYNWRFK